MAYPGRVTDTVAPTPEAPATPARRRISAVGVIGELFILVGVILGLYVFWELVYTDFQAAAIQEEALEESGFDTEGIVDQIVAGEGAQDEDAVDVEVTDVIAADEMFTSEAPVISTPAHASTFATFWVPRWGEDYARPISEGVTRPDVLDTLGIGRYPETQMPGAYGNFAISAHRTTYNKPFTNIETLQLGDALVVQTQDTWYVYEVTESYIVQPTQVEVLAPVPNQPGASANERYITLTTCHPRYSNTQRWIVHGTLKYWANVEDGIPPELVEGVE